MDIKAKIEEIVNKIKGDKSLLSRFQKEPVKVIEGLIGVDLPDEKLKSVVDGVKAKLSADDVKKMLDADGDGKIELDDAKAMLGKLFKK